jgi:TfoX/Sxy family transcriptional regulator of competence genes
MMPAKTKARKFKPSPEWIKELFSKAVGDFSEAEPRKMFGYPCAFVRGNMTCGVFEDRLMLRLPDSERATFLKLPGARPFEPRPGRVMREYVEVPDDILKSIKLRTWLKKSFAYTRSLPPKVKKK